MFRIGTALNDLFADTYALTRSVSAFSCNIVIDTRL